MDIEIEVLEIDGPNKSAKGRWEELTVTYKDLKDESVRTKKLVSFGDQKPCFDFFSDDSINTGGICVVTLKKDGKFWNWVEVTSGSDESKTRASKTSNHTKGVTTKPSGGNWETPVERQARQLSICRQNALTNAVNACGENVSVEVILGLADKFFAYTSQDFNPDYKSIKEQTTAKII